MGLSFYRVPLEEVGGREQVYIGRVAQWTILRQSQCYIRGMSLLAGQVNIRKGCLEGTTPPLRAKVLREQSGGSFYVTVK